MLITLINLSAQANRHKSPSQTMNHFDSSGTSKEHIEINVSMGCTCTLVPTHTNKIPMVILALSLCRYRATHSTTRIGAQVQSPPGLEKSERVCSS